MIRLLVILFNLAASVIHAVVFIHAFDYLVILAELVVVQEVVLLNVIKKYSYRHDRMFLLFDCHSRIVGLVELWNILSLVFIKVLLQDLVIEKFGFECLVLASMVFLLEWLNCL